MKAVSFLIAPCALLVSGVSFAASPTPKPSNLPLLDPSAASDSFTNASPRTTPSSQPVVVPTPALVNPADLKPTTPSSDEGVADKSVDDSKPVELSDLTLDRNGGINLTLERSVELAIRGATSVLQQENNVKASAANLLQSYGQFLPNLTAHGNYTYSTGTTYLTSGTPALVNGDTTGAGYTLSSDLNIFNGLADFANFKSSRLKKDAADLTLTRVKQMIALDITQGFLQVILDEKIVDIARKTLQESQAREALLDEQTKVGARNLSDLFRQQAQTSSDEAFLFTSENKTRSDQIAFLRKLRADVSKKYHFLDFQPSDETLDPRYSDESNMMREALAHRTDLEASDKVAEASRWDVKTNWSGYLPKLDLIGSIVSGGAYINNQSVNGASVTPAVQSNLAYQLGNQIDYTVTLNLSWTIFDRFITHQNVSQASAVAENLAIDAQDRRNQVEGDVRAAYGDYKTAKQQLISSKKGIDAAEKAFELMEGRYEVGSANFVDLITAQTVLVQAESARAQALINFKLQQKSIEFALGETPVVE